MRYTTIKSYVVALVCTAMTQSYALMVIPPTSYSKHTRCTFISSSIHKSYIRSNNHCKSIDTIIHQQSYVQSTDHCKYPQTTHYMSKYDGEDENNEDVPIEKERQDKNKPTSSFIDALLEIPDSRLFLGDILFLLMINFLLQIGAEISSPDYWANGGLLQPVTFPVTLSTVVIRDSKMSISWIMAALWNRSYSSSAVESDNIAIKTTWQIFIDYCSLRILFELGTSLLLTHTAVDVWALGIEAWYTLIVMSGFRIAYGRFR